MGEPRPPDPRRGVPPGRGGRGSGRAFICPISGGAWSRGNPSCDSGVLTNDASRPCSRRLRSLSCRGRSRSGGCTADPHHQRQATPPPSRDLRLAEHRHDHSEQSRHEANATETTCGSSPHDDLDVLGAAVERLLEKRQACDRSTTETGRPGGALLSGVAWPTGSARPALGGLATTCNSEGPCDPAPEWGSHQHSVAESGPR